MTGSWAATLDVWPDSVTHRVPVKCRNCTKPMTVRVVVAGGHQPFVFACPHCAAPLHAVFHARLEPMELRLESDDMEVVDAEEPDALGVAIAVDVPVHLGLVGATGKASMISPFILVAGELGMERAGDLVDRVNELRALREQLFPGVRRAGAFWGDRDLSGLTEAIRAIPGSDHLDWDNDTSMSMFDDLLDMLYGPIEQSDARTTCAEEFLQHVGKALDDHPAELQTLFADFGPPLEDHRRRTVSAVFAALKDVDAFFPALWAEAMEGTVDLEPYRVMRDDFAQRKSSFQDLFELASRTLAFVAPIVNLAVRGDANSYSDGKSRTPNKARRKVHAADRAEWLVELPATRARYDAVSRTTRNEIGHALVRQDVRRGTIVYEDGTEQNYMLFLVDWLNAVRLIRYAIDVIMVLDYTRAALHARAATGYKDG